MTGQMPSTFYVRLSLMVPKRGCAERVSKITDELLDYFSQQPGYVRGYKLTTSDGSGELGRLTVWTSEQEADRVATSEHVLAVRSELMQLIEEDSHVERSFTAFDPQLARAAAS
jgi:quinol monooxygenase YgiN